MAHSVSGIRAPYAEGLHRGPDTLPTSFTYIAYRYLNRPVWFAARVLEDARSPAEIEYEERRVSLSSTESEELLRPQRMSYAGPLPTIPKSKGNEWKRRTAPVGMMGLSGIHTPPLSPKTPARRAGSPAALIGAAMLSQASPTPPSSTAGSPTPFSTTPGRPVLGRPASARFARSTTPPVSSPASSPAPSPSSAHKVRPWEKRLSGLSATPERSDSLESTASAASTISTYSYDVQVVRAARVSTHEGVLASPILGKAASLKSRPTSLSASTPRLSVPSIQPEDAAGEDDSFLAYLNPAAGGEELEPILEIIKPSPEETERKAGEMLWLVENISGHQFYVPDSDVIAVPEAEHRRLRAQENRHFWPVYTSQLEFLALRRRDIRRRHRANRAYASGREKPSALLVEFTDRFEYADSHEPPLPGQHDAALNAAFRSLRKAEGLPAEDVVLSESGEMVTLRSVEGVAGMLRGGWFECDDEFWEDARASF